MKKIFLIFQKLILGRDWTCPICEFRVQNGRTTCPCGCDFRVILFSQTPDCGNMFIEIESLFFRCLDITTVPVSEHQKQKQLTYFQKDVEKMVKSPEMQKLEDRGWRIRALVSNLFIQCSEGKSIVLFSLPDLPPMTDVNSSGLFALLFRHLERRRQDLLSENPSYENVEMKIVQNPSVNEENYEDFEDQTFRVHENTKKFLDSHKKLFLTIAKQIAEGSDLQSWVCMVVLNINFIIMFNLVF